LSGAAHADLLGGGVAGGLASQIETRTVGAFGDRAGIDAWGRADAMATANISTPQTEPIRSEARGMVTGTAHRAVYTGQELGAQTEAQSRAAVGRADRAGRRAAAEGAVVANGAYASSTAAASNVGAAVNSGSDADVGIATDDAYVGTSGGARGDLATSSSEGPDSAVRSDAAANAVVDSRFGGTAEGAVESSVAGSASAK
jgi:hypothetical protein